MEKKFVNPHLHQQQQQKQKQYHINLKNLPPINPSTTTSIPCYQVKKSKTITKYVPKVAKPRPEVEEEQEQEDVVKVVKFDLQANTEADLLAEQEQLNDDTSSSVCAIKHIDPNNFVKQTQSKLCYESSGDDKVLLVDSGEQKMVSAKSQLHEICVANNWRPPIYECCKEEGPCHLRLFTFKAVVEIEGVESIVLECYGAPRPKKKTAADHAAEGALWYFKHLGYFPIKKWENKEKKKN